MIISAYKYRTWVPPSTLVDCRALNLIVGAPGRGTHEILPNEIMASHHSLIFPERIKDFLANLI
jgi:hypothetical protein